jgi:ferredoxin
MRKCRSFTKPSLQSLIRLLHERGYTVIGPTEREGAIVYDEIAGAAELPWGLRDRQAPGSYRLEAGDDPERCFDYTAGPSSWKKFVHPPRKSLFTIHQDGWVIEPPPPPPPMAFLGVRSCELAALAVLNRAVPLQQQPFLIAVECMRAGELCFCVSMKTGPAAGPGYDLALDELDDRFLARAGTERGQEVLDQLETLPAQPEEVEQARRMVEAAAGQMGRELKTEGVRELLLGNLEHPQWDDVASRCLGCANCTMVCPTCFCTTVEDHTDLSGQTAERVQLWDSCFNLDFTYTNGAPARQSIRSRYRQWLTHKLAYWQDQFGTSGCVGCGRCIAWCPVGIDLTAEVAAIQNKETP